jgi:gliding motility-associated-like protein
LNIENNIDQLLSAQMSDCKVEAPEGLWEAIQTELPTQLPSDAGASLGGKVMGAVKSMSLGAKVALIAGGLAIGGFTIYELQKKVSVEPSPSLVLSQSSEVGLNQTPMTEENAKEVAASKAPLVQTEKAKPNKPKTAEGNTTNTVSSEIEIEQTQNQAEVPEPMATPISPKPETVIPKPEVIKEIANKLPEEQLQMIKEEELTRKEDFTEKRQPKYTNTFSPNGDGKNDTWFVDIEEVSDFELKIYKANGELVFETTDPVAHWNGDNSKNGTVCEAGVYIFVLHYKLENESKFMTKNGTIKLFR